MLQRNKCMAEALSQSLVQIGPLVLTLVIVPAGFTLADDMEKWIGPRLGKLLVNNEEHKSGPAAQPAE